MDVSACGGSSPRLHALGPRLSADGAVIRQACQRKVGATPAMTGSSVARLTSAATSGARNGWMSTSSSRRTSAKSCAS
eukprot:3300197-Prymnesium_polylepis.1